MSEYGLTQNGVNIKRLDTIIDEMHTDLSNSWGVNTRQNQTSLLNVLITNIADSLSELWELGQDVYNSTYPNSAEGMYLDNAAQFAGISREEQAKSYYHILCTGTEGTVIPDNTLIRTEMNPVTELTPSTQYQLSRTQFNTAVVKAVTADGNPFTIVLNGESYSATLEKGGELSKAMKEISGLINSGDGFDSSVDDETGYLYITSDDVSSQNTMVLSDNLTTQSIGCVYTFETKEYGDIYLPEGSITDIGRAVTGLESVTNVGTYIKGRLVETDSEFRSSYIDRIFSHSSRMRDSIRSAILTNVQGVSSVEVYENCTSQVDEYGRYPHSIEVVCDGGDSTEIAQQILNTKAGGISTYGSTEIVVHGDYEDEITIRFNRPEYIYTWFRVKLTIAKGTSVISNYADIVREIILDKVDGLGCGGDIIPQSLLLSDIYSMVKGIDFVEVDMGTGREKPESYTERNIYVTERQRAVTSKDRIEVVIDG